MDHGITPKAEWQARHEATLLPPFEYGPWVETPNSALVTAKQRIAVLDANGKWELLKKMVNPYEIVHTHEDPDFHPSIANVRPLSRSYFKMIEMLRILGTPALLRSIGGTLRTAHVAEGPGGFIQAITTMLQEHPETTLERATAMTLKPTDKRVPGWRRAAGFLHRHREVRLHFGVDGTGDVYQLGNQDSFVEACAPGVHLFTADGGFDFSVNYEDQERRVFHLLVCSATVGLRSLCKGGQFVLKLFDLFSPSTRILVALMSRHFQEWMLYKPALSRPCNSECYFLGRGFRGMRQDMLQIFLDLQRESRAERFPQKEGAILSEQEQMYLRTHMDRMVDSQLKALARAENYATHPELWFTDQIQRDFQTSYRWCKEYGVPVAMTTPRSLTCPSHLLQNTCSLDAGPQSQLPDGDSENHSRSDPA